MNKTWICVIRIVIGCGAIAEQITGGQQWFTFAGVVWLILPAAAYLIGATPEE